MNKAINTLLVLAAVLMWSFSFPLIKASLSKGVPPITLATLRTLISIPILAFLIIKRNLPKSRKDWLFFLGIGFFSIILPNIAQNVGMMYTSASISSIIQTSGPIFTIILAIILLRESSDFKKVCGAIIALTGTILLILSRDRELSIVGVTVYGNFLILLSSVSYAFASILTKKGLGRIKPLEMLGYSTFIGFIALTIAAIPERPLEVVKNLTLELWAIVFLLAVFPTFIACLLWYKVMISEEVSRLILFVYLMPVFAVLFSFILLGEIISPQTIIFAIMIIGGVALAERTK